MFERIAEGRKRLRHGTRAVSRQVDIGMGRIFVDHGFQWDGVDNVWMTRARASYVISAGPAFDIRPRGLLSRMVGIQVGIPSGDRCFDDFFVVRSDSPTATWAALNNRVRSLLVGSFEDARLVSDGKFVTLWREAPFGREADSEAAAELVSEIVHFQSNILGPLKQISGCTYSEPRGQWDRRTAPKLLIHTPTPVTISPAYKKGIAVMTARAQRGPGVKPFWLEIDEQGKIKGNLDRIPPGVARVFSTTGRCSLRCLNDQVKLTWPSLEASRLKISAGAHLVGAFANGHRLYR